MQRRRGDLTRLRVGVNVDALPPPAACRLYVKIHASCQPLEMMAALQPSIVENGARRSRRCGQAPQHTHVPAERSPSLKWQSLARCGVQAELLMNPCLQYFRRGKAREGEGGLDSSRNPTPQLSMFAPRARRAGRDCVFGFVCGEKVRISYVQSRNRESRVQRAAPLPLYGVWTLS